MVEQCLWFNATELYRFFIAYSTTWTDNNVLASVLGSSFVV